MKHWKATLLGVFAAAILTAVVAPMAAAGQPVIVHKVHTETDVLTGACSFPITVVASISETDRFFSDQNGTLTRANADFTEQDTFSANGKSLVGDPYAGTIQAYFDSNGNITQEFVDGVVERVPLPDGSIFQAAGRVNLAAHDFPTFVVTPDAGSARNLAGFCAALAP